APGGGNHAGDRRVRNNEFQEELRPRRAVDVGGPGGQLMPLQALEECSLAKRPVDDYRQPPLGRERQKTLLRLPIQHVVAELYEVNGLRAHDLFQEAVKPALRAGDTDVAHASLRFHRLQRLDMGAPVEKVMYLNEVETIDAPELARGL